MESPFGGEIEGYDVWRVVSYSDCGIDEEKWLRYLHVYTFKTPEPSNEAS